MFDVRSVAARSTQRRESRPATPRLWIEFLLIFIAIPMALALLLPPSAMYPLLLGGALAGAVLLHFTRGFSWSELLGPVAWGPVLALFALTFAVASALCWVLLPERLWFLLREEPRILLMVALFYPPVLVVPQEIVYRPLFFRRYGHLFPRELALWVNAAVFALGHLMYWHWAVLVLTFAGSVIFARAYLAGRGFMQAVALHAAAGFAVFASGLGWLFYSGGYVVNGH